MNRVLVPDTWILWWTKVHQRDRNHLITNRFYFEYFLHFIQVRTDVSEDDALQSSANSLSWDYNASPVELDNRNNQQMSAVERAERSKSFPQSGTCKTRGCLLLEKYFFPLMPLLTFIWLEIGVDEWLKNSKKVWKNMRNSLEATVIALETFYRTKTQFVGSWKTVKIC